MIGAIIERIAPDSLLLSTLKWYWADISILYRQIIKVKIIDYGSISDILIWLHLFDLFLFILRRIDHLKNHFQVIPQSIPKLNIY